MKTAQRGVAVIMALLLTTLAVTIVASLFWEQQIQIRAIENQRLQLQKQWLLRAALDWARLLLREDARNSQIDCLQESWAAELYETQLAQYIAELADTQTETLLSGKIHDAQGRYNLSNLSVGGQINEREVARLQRLLSQVHLDSGLALIIAQRLANAQPKETQDQQRLTPPGIQQLPLIDIDDLLAIPAFTPAMLQRLQDLVILLPRPTSLNVNTTSAAVLGVYLESPTQGQEIVAVRTRGGCFKDPQDFIQRTQLQSSSAGASNLTISSQYFLVDYQIHIGHAGLGLQALIERNDTGTTLLWTKEN